MLLELILKNRVKIQLQKMCEANIITKIFFIAFFFSPLHGYSIKSIQNDFADIVMPEEYSDNVYVTKEEINTDDLMEVKVDQNQQKMTMKILQDVQMKIKELEMNEKQLREELYIAKNKLNAKKKEQPEVIFIREDEKQKKEAEGFWATICKIGKGLLNGLLNFFGIKI